MIITKKRNLKPTTYVGTSKSGLRPKIKMTASDAIFRTALKKNTWTLKDFIPDQLDDLKKG